MKKYFIFASVTAAIIVMSAVVMSCGGDSGTATKGASQTAGSPVLPVAENPIKNNSTTPGLVIASARAEDNFDPETRKDIPDSLQIELKNSSAQTMNNLEIFSRMTDSSTGASEGYYQKLDGLNLSPGETKTIFFDNKTTPGHYPENKYSLYRTSKSEVAFSIVLSAPGFKPATGETKKAPGTGEQQD